MTVERSLKEIVAGDALLSGCDAGDGVSNSSGIVGNVRKNGEEVLLCSF